MCMYDEGDGPAILLHQRQPKAIKDHICGECGRVIFKGETYTVERTVFDHMASTHKTCNHCGVSRQWLMEECGGYMYNGIAEDIRDHAINGFYGLRMQIMAVGIVSKWKRRDGRLYPIPKMPRLTPK